MEALARVLGVGVMVTEAEIAEFHLLSQRRAARRFLPEPVTPTGFDALPLDFAKSPGRAPLQQSPDFYAEITARLLKEEMRHGK